MVYWLGFPIFAFKFVSLFVIALSHSLLLYTSSSSSSRGTTFFMLPLTESRNFLTTKSWASERTYTNSTELASSYEPNHPPCSHCIPCSYLSYAGKTKSVSISLQVFTALLYPGMNAAAAAAAAWGWVRYCRLKQLAAALLYFLACLVASYNYATIVPNFVLRNLEDDIAVALTAKHQDGYLLNMLSHFIETKLF